MIKPLALAAALVALTTPCHAQGLDLRVPPLGTATLATNRQIRHLLVRENAPVSESLPCHDLTLTYWQATRIATGGEYNPGGVVSRLDYARSFPELLYVPRLETTAPDILGGAFGWGGASVAFSGTTSRAVTIPAPAVDYYDGKTPLTVAWTNLTADLSLSLGGATATLKTGSGNRNILAAPGSSSLTLSGTARGCVGVSVAPINRFFSARPANLITEANIDDTAPNTNYVFIAHRLHLDTATHRVATTIITQAGREYSAAESLDMPPNGATAFEEGGYYKFSETAMAYTLALYLYKWDMRVFPRWLDDFDIRAIYEDGSRIRTAFGYPPCVYTNAVFQVDP